MIERIIDDYKVIEYDKTNILIIENIIEDTLCNDLINLINTLPLDKHVYKKGNNVNCYSTILNNIINNNQEEFYSFSTAEIEIKRSLENIINKKKVSTNKLNGISKDKLKEYKSIIDEKIKLLDKLISKTELKLSFNSISAYILRKIFGKTRTHIDGINLNEHSSNNIFYVKDNILNDSINTLIRNASIIFTLNDNYDGGTFRFPYQDVSIKLKKGSVLIFPPYWTHPHETDELENNTFRYTISTWSYEEINKELKL